MPIVKKVFWHSKYMHYKAAILAIAIVAMVAAFMILHNGLGHPAAAISNSTAKALSATQLTPVGRCTQEANTTGMFVCKEGQYFPGYKLLQIDYNFVRALQYTSCNGSWPVGTYNTDCGNVVGLPIDNTLGICWDYGNATSGAYANATSFELVSINRSAAVVIVIPANSPGLCTGGPSVDTNGT